MGRSGFRIFCHDRFLLLWYDYCYCFLHCLYVYLFFYQRAFHEVVLEYLRICSLLLPTLGCVLIVRFVFYINFVDRKSVV